MRAGKLRQRVTIQEQAITTNERGAQEPGWVNVATVWADVATAAGRERSGNELVVATLSHTVTMRYRPGLTAAHRLKWGKRALSLLATPDPDNQRRMLVCQCQEIEGDPEVV